MSKWVNRHPLVATLLFVLLVACAGTSAGRMSRMQSGVGGGQSGIGGGSGVSNTLFCGATVACAGTTQSGVKIAYGRAPLTSGTPSTAVLTSLPFTSSSSYSCTASDDTSVVAIEVTYTSGASATLTGGASVTDTISYVCVGI